MDEWTDKNGDVYRLDADAPEGVVRYLLVKKVKAPAKAKAPAKKSKSKSKKKE
ncbi:hypothetical protein N8748_00610 [bacterium]|nr:hypothetical protein [bacterium]|tara:strand:- start:732 stop:890 length:159 start_codon:yes stop_codon:yes gene_type:complete